jgi:hypothetical protein
VANDLIDENTARAIEEASKAAAMRGPGESYSDVIRRLVEMETLARFRSRLRGKEDPPETRR